MKKISIIAALFFASCNAAVDGYNAPLGSVITFTPNSSSYEACGGAGRLVKIAISIQTPNSLSGQLQPGQNIYGELEANGPTNLYLKAENADQLVPILSQVELVTSGNLTFTTDKRGIFEFVAEAPGLLEGYQDCINAYIGVAANSFCFDVQCNAD